MRLLDEKDKQIGVFTTKEALDKAGEFGVDLVEIAPKADPPVCKLIDFKKFKYQQKKRERQLRKKAKTVELKQIVLRPYIGEHDFNIRCQRAKDFLKDNDRVKVIVQFFGRQITHKEFGYKIMDKLKEELAHLSTLDREPRFEGKKLVAHFSPKKGKRNEKKDEDQKISN